MAPSPSRPRGPTAASDSIEAILALEKEDQRKLAPVHRVFHAIGAFFGTIYFIALQAALVGLWIVFNSSHVFRAWHVDPFPYPLLATFLSLEAVLLTSCVLIRQNAIDRTSERRDHLELQINLLAEKEATRALDLLNRISQHLGVPDAGDHETNELAKATSVDEIAQDLRRREGAAESDQRP